MIPATAEIIAGYWSQTLEHSHSLFIKHQAFTVLKKKQKTKMKQIVYTLNKIGFRFMVVDEKFCCHWKNSAALVESPHWNYESFYTILNCALYYKTDFYIHCE